MIEWIKNFFKYKPKYKIGQIVRMKIESPGSLIHVYYKIVGIMNLTYASIYGWKYLDQSVIKGMFSINVTSEVKYIYEVKDLDKNKMVTLHY